MKLTPFLLLALALLACAMPIATQSAPTRVGPPPARTGPAATLAPGAPPILIDPAAEQQLYIELYQRVNPSVVSIRILDSGGIDEALGSGFVIDQEGHIVTNHHVVEGAVQVEVDFSGGFKAEGKVLGTDPTADLAVLKVDAPAETLIPVPLGDSDQVQVGQRVVAIGNPFGLSGTMTVGIVSGLDRVLPSDIAAPHGGQFSAPDIIQTDAAINPGNSGGPLLNLNGEVIGVNKAIESQTGVNSGVGFSIASNTVKRIAPALIKDGRFVYPYLGISSIDGLSLTQIETLGLPQTEGAYITAVVVGGPADQAGLRGDRSGANRGLMGGGDLIIALDGQPVKSFSEVLSYLVNNTSVGQAITLTVIRDGSQMDIPVTLGARP